MVGRSLATSRWMTATVLAILALALPASLVLAASSLTLTPGHGQAADPLTITYQTDAVGCPGSEVRVGWDGATEQRHAALWAEAAFG